MWSKGNYLSKTVNNQSRSKGTMKFLLNNFNRYVCPLIDRCLILVWYSRCGLVCSCGDVSIPVDICRRVSSVMITGRPDVDEAIYDKKKSSWNLFLLCEFVFITSYRRDRCGCREWGRCRRRRPKNDSDSWLCRTVVDGVWGGVPWDSRGICSMVVSMSSLTLRAMTSLIRKNDEDGCIGKKSFEETIPQWFGIGRFHSCLTWCIAKNVGKKFA